MPGSPTRMDDFFSPRWMKIFIVFSSVVFLSFFLSISFLMLKIPLDRSIVNNRLTHPRLG